MKNAVARAIPTRPRSIRKRAAILAGAKEVFLEQGYGSASMDIISERADVSKRTIYKHFVSKYDLFSAVVRRLCTNVLPPAEEIDAYKDKSIEESLHTLAVQFLHEIYHPDQVALFRTIIAEARQFPELGATFYDGPISASEHKIGAYFLYVVRTGELTFERPEIAAAQFLGLLKGDMHLRLLFMKRKRANRSEIDKEAHSAVNLFLQGALPRA
jgi:TetR/AcrR family transcriptional repressor of mexJK operon